MPAVVACDAAQRKPNKKRGGCLSTFYSLHLLWCARFFKFKKNPFSCLGLFVCQTGLDLQVRPRLRERQTVCVCVMFLTLCVCADYVCFVVLIVFCFLMCVWGEGYTTLDWQENATQHLYFHTKLN